MVTFSLSIVIRWKPTNVTIVEGPKGGDLALNTDGTFTYTPNGDFSGSDSFPVSV